MASYEARNGRPRVKYTLSSTAAVNSGNTYPFDTVVADWSEDGFSSASGVITVDESGWYRIDCQVFFQTNMGSNGTIILFGPSGAEAYSHFNGGTSEGRSYWMDATLYLQAGESIDIRQDNITGPAISSPTSVTIERIA